METTSAKLEIRNVNIDIHSINFKKIYEDVNDVEAQISQKAELKNVTLDFINLYVTRSISFEPKCLFDLVVTADVTLYLNRENSSDFDGDLNAMKEYVTAKLSYLVDKCGVGNVLSSMISQITGNCGNIPFITPSNVNDSIE